MRNELAIFCISLARATERRKKMQQEWCDRFGFDIQFFEAFDRRDLPGKAMLVENQAKSMAMVGRCLTSGEIACATSHYLLCKKILAEGYQEAIIMEDDVYPFPKGFKTKEEFFQRIDIAKNAFPGLKALILHSADNVGRVRWKGMLRQCFKRLLGLPHKPYQSTAVSNDCHLLNVPPWGTRLMWYNRAGLELMAKHLNPLYLPVDWVIRLRDFVDGHIALLDPPLAGHYGDDSFIENERFGNKKRLYRP